MYLAAAFAWGQAFPIATPQPTWLSISWSFSVSKSHTVLHVDTLPLQHLAQTGHLVYAAVEHIAFRRIVEILHLQVLSQVGQLVPQVTGTLQRHAQGLVLAVVIRLGTIFEIRFSKAVSPKTETISCHPE